MRGGESGDAGGRTARFGITKSCYLGVWCPERKIKVAAIEITNLLAGTFAETPDEFSEVLVENQHVRIERIVSYGQASPAGFWYDQAEHEWVTVLTGRAKLRFEDRTIEMGPGDCVNIPAHTKHRVEWTMPEGPTIWLAVHYVGDGS